MHTDINAFDQLPILPCSEVVIRTKFKMETIRLDECGDREEISVASSYFISTDVPVITFMDWIMTLLHLKRHGIDVYHHYAKFIEPYKPHDSDVWQFFNQVRDNKLFSNGRVCNYLYFISEFNYYVVKN